MTQEDKKLLLKDLSARQLYKVVLFCKNDNEDIRIGRMIDFCCDLPYTPTIWIVDNKNNLPYEYRPTYEIVRPYLRPKSSMTKEEEAEYSCISAHKDNIPTVNYLPISDYMTVDWLNAHHFDYRGLIEKGLALEAPEGMYK
jgi:hypothetical protein